MEQWQFCNCNTRNQVSIEHRTPYERRLAAGREGSNAGTWKEGVETEGGGIDGRRGKDGRRG
jgi:hypothetical protein